MPAHRFRPTITLRPISRRRVRGCLVALLLVPAGSWAQDGNWNIANRGVDSFAGWARTSGVEPLVGDFDGDGRSDVTLIRRSGGLGHDADRLRTR